MWSHQLEWQPMNWDYWTWLNCKVLSLATGDIDGDGTDEILAGCADRHVYAFDEGGAVKWRSACQWGPPTCLAVARLRDGRGRQVLAGMADPSIHGCVRVFGSDGACVQTLSRPDIMSWSIPSWSRCLRAADVDGDGWEEVLSGVDTNHRQLIVYNRDGDVLWDADLGGAALSVETAGGCVYVGGFERVRAVLQGRWHTVVEPFSGGACDRAGSRWQWRVSGGASGRGGSWAWTRRARSGRRGATGWK